jgi:hypothetical protein
LWGDGVVVDEMLVGGACARGGGFGGAGLGLGGRELGLVLRLSDEFWLLGIFVAAAVVVAAVVVVVAIAAPIASTAAVALVGLVAAVLLVLVLGRGLLVVLVYEFALDGLGF